MKKGKEEDEEEEEKMNKTFDVYATNNAYKFQFTLR